MKLVRAKVLGFCMGVRRAVEMATSALADTAALAGTALAESARAESAGHPIYTLGPLIHNPQVLDSLAKKGMRILEEEDLSADLSTDKSSRDLSNATVIIRAHGVCPATEQKLRERGAIVIDATCPHVKASQLSALEMAQKGYRVFLAGERDHAELKGIYGYALSGASEYAEQNLCNDSRQPYLRQSCLIVGNPQEAENAAGALWNEDSASQTALIGQTTISEDEYRAIAEAIQKTFPGLEVINTICGATRNRQNALRELCSQVDAVIVAGGKDSANTRRLLSIAQSCGKPACLVENATALRELRTLPAFDIPPEVIGISAGASTPDSVIDEIEKFFKNFYHGVTRSGIRSF